MKKLMTALLMSLVLASTSVLALHVTGASVSGAGELNADPYRHVGVEDVSGKGIAGGYSPYKITPSSAIYRQSGVTSNGVTGYALLGPRFYGNAYGGNGNAYARFDTVEFQGSLGTYRKVLNTPATYNPAERSYRGRISRSDGLSQRRSQEVRFIPRFIGNQQVQ